MAGSLTITIPNLSALGVGNSRRAEASEITAMVETALQQMVSTLSTSVSFKDRNGNAAGTLSWTPVNSV